MRQTAFEELGYVVTFERISFHDRHQQWRTNARSQSITNALYNFPLNHRQILKLHYDPIHSHYRKLACGSHASLKQEIFLHRERD
jgi:hypothetical protein